MAPTPPPLSKPTPLPHNSLGIEVLAISSVGIFIDLIAIGLRLWSRKLRKRAFDAGDFLIIAAWLFAFADVIRKIIAFKWGVGLHMSEILSTDPSHLLDAGAITFAGYFVWSTSTTCIKLSILLGYYDFFFVITWFVRTVYAVIGLTVVLFFANIIGLAAGCSPIQYNWDTSIPGGHCGITRSQSFYLSGALNLALDVIIVALPLPVIWTLRVSGLRKVGISAMFSLGAIIVVLVGYRFHLIQRQNEEDYIHDGEIAGIFTSLELYLGMISACLPYISPSIKTINTSLSTSRLRLYLQSSSRGSNKSTATDDSLQLVESGKRSGSLKNVAAKDPYVVTAMATTDVEYQVEARRE